MEAIYICDDPVFYFNGRELVICISSFELTSQVDNLIEFPISFKKIKNILSDYAPVSYTHLLGIGKVRTQMVII